MSHTHREPHPLLSKVFISCKTHRVGYRWKGLGGSNSVILQYGSSALNHTHREPHQAGTTPIENHTPTCRNLCFRCNPSSGVSLERSWLWQQFCDTNTTILSHTHLGPHPLVEKFYFHLNISNGVSLERRGSHQPNDNERITLNHTHCEPHPPYIESFIFDKTYRVGYRWKGLCRSNSMMLLPPL